MRRELRRDLNRVGMILLLLLAANLLLRLPFLTLRRSLELTMSLKLPIALQQLSVGLVYAGAMVLTIFAGLRLWRCSPDFLLPLAPPRRDFFLPALGMGLGLAMGSNLAIGLFTGLLEQAGVGVRAFPPDFSGGPLAVLILLFSLTLLPAILEELLFRGVLLQPLRRYGDRIAVVLSALAFALCHTSLPQVLNAFLLGLLLGMLTVRTGSLLTSMALHLLYNGYCCLVSLLWYYAPTPGVALASGLMSLFLLIQGSYCIFLLRRRFGRALWLPPAAALRPGQVVMGALCSVPLLVAGLFYIAEIAQSLYWI